MAVSFRPWFPVTYIVAFSFAVQFAGVDDRLALCHHCFELLLSVEVSGRIDVVSSGSFLPSGPSAGGEVLAMHSSCRRIP